MSFHARCLSSFFRLLYKVPFHSQLESHRFSMFNTPIVIQSPGLLNTVLTWDTFSCIIPQRPARIPPPQKPSVAIPVYDHCLLLRALGLLDRDKASVLSSRSIPWKLTSHCLISIIVGSLCLSFYHCLSSIRESTFPYSLLNPLKSSRGLAHIKCLINICQFE